MVSSLIMRISCRLPQGRRVGALVVLEVGLLVGIKGRKVASHLS